MYWTGMLMFALAGGLLHDVPFPRFLSAFILITLGTTFAILDKA